MTRIADRRTRLRFETDSVVRSVGRQRAVIVEPQSGFVLLSLKGTRKQFALTYGQMYDLAAKLEANRVRAEKKAAKKGGR